MKKWILIFLFIACLIPLNLSWAKYIIEPYVGMNFLSIMKRAPNFKWEYDGIIYGGRLGRRFYRFIFGLDYAVIKTELVCMSPPGYYTEENLKLNYENKYWSLFLAFDMGTKWRLQGSWFFYTKFSLQEGNDDGDYRRGQGQGVTLSYLLRSYFSINFIYRNLFLDKQWDISRQEKSSLSPAYKVTEYLVTISLPLPFFSSNTKK